MTTDKTIPMRSVVSSQVDSIGHDTHTNTLRVRFKSGGVYDYHGVTEELYNRLMNANSLGQFMHKVIKPSHKAVKVG